MISGALYIGATLTLLVAIGKNDISVLQGIVQGVSQMAAQSRRRVDRGSLCRHAQLSRLQASVRLGWEVRLAFHSLLASIPTCPRRWGRSTPSTEPLTSLLSCRVIVSLVLIILELYSFRRRSGSVPEDALRRGSIATHSIFCMSSRRWSSLPSAARWKALATGASTLLFAGVAGLVTTTLGDHRRILPRQADYVLVEVRSQHVRNYTGICWPWRCFSFMVYGRRKCENI